MTASIQPTFGQLIRGYRLGWGWCNRLGGFMRIRALPVGYKIECRPAGLVPNEARQKMEETHFVWWSDASRSHEIIESIAVLKNVRRIKIPFQIIVNEDGELMR